MLVSSVLSGVFEILGKYLLIRACSKYLAFLKERKSVNVPSLRNLFFAASVASALTLSAFSQAAKADSVSTDFDPPEILNGTEVVELFADSFTATISGGEANTLGRPELYNIPNSSFLITGAGAGGAGSVGLIDFSAPVEFVSLTAANGGNGQATINVLDDFDNLLTSATVTTTEISDPGSQFEFLFDRISSIEIINPGPASPPNPPYLTAIGSFSAEAAVPEPTLMAGLGLVGASMFLLRRRQKGNLESI